MWTHQFRKGYNENVREHITRAAFSFLAAAVCLAMAQEHFTWAIQRRHWWEFGAAYILASFAMLEAHFVWQRAEHLLGISHG